jgi:hypothetical protein
MKAATTECAQRSEGKQQTGLLATNARRENMMTSNEVKELVAQRYGRFADTGGNAESC